MHHYLTSLLHLFFFPQLTKQIITQTYCIRGLLLKVKEKNIPSDAPNAIVVTQEHPKNNIPIQPNCL